MKNIQFYRSILFTTLLLILITVSGFSQSLNYEVYKLKNGLQILFIDYGTVEATAIRMYVNVGQKNETPGFQGISDLTAQALLYGNVKYGKIKQQDLLYSMGTTMSANANEKYTTVSCSFLNRDIDAGLDVFAAAVRQPLFPAEEVKQQISEFMQYNNPKKMDISELAQRFSNLFVFGINNPLGRNTYSAQVGKFVANDYKEFYNFNYTPKNTKIVVAGKLDKEKLKALFEKQFGNWESASGEINQVSFEQPVFKGKEYAFVNRDNATQVYLLWAKKAPTISDKDLLAFKMSISLFNRRLFEEVREKLGKTYGIYMSFNESQNNGIYTVSTQTRSKEMVSTMQAFDKTLENFYNTGITENELSRTKVKMKNSYLSINEPSSIIGYFNPLIYPDIKKRLNFLNDIDVITVETVNKAIKKYYNPESYKLVIAGNNTELSDQLTKLKGLQKFENNAIEVNQ